MRPAPAGQLVRRLDGLTGRGRDVLALIGRGLSNDEICRRLHVTMPTDEAHIGRLLPSRCVSSAETLYQVLSPYETLVNRVVNSIGDGAQSPRGAVTRTFVSERRPLTGARPGTLRVYV